MFHIVTKALVLWQITFWSAEGKQSAFGFWLLVPTGMFEGRPLKGARAKFSISIPIKNIAMWWLSRGLLSCTSVDVLQSLTHLAVGTWWELHAAVAELLCGACEEWWFSSLLWWQVCLFVVLWWFLFFKQILIKNNMGEVVWFWLGSE